MPGLEPGTSSSVGLRDIRLRYTANFSTETHFAILGFEHLCNCAARKKKNTTCGRYLFFSSSLTVTYKNQQ